VALVYAAPSHVCPADMKLDVVGYKCVGSDKLGYAKCPAGMKLCVLASFHRPLCAAQDKVFGVDACLVFDALSLAHKLPKIACP